MERINRGNIGIWVINLAQSTDRRKRMEDQLGKLGLNYTIFPAIDGYSQEKHLVHRVDKDAYRRNTGVPVLPGDIGVYASHMAVWETLLGSSFDIGLILEDDVIFHDDFLDALDMVLAKAQHWDVVRFCSVRAKMPFCQGRVGHYRLNAYLGPFVSNVAYLIHRNVAERLLPGLWPQTRALDHELNRFYVHRYRLRGLEPFACHTDDGGFSTITGERFENVRKPRWYKRLPYYRLKAGNYFRRGSWLVRHGEMPGSSKILR